MVFPNRLASSNSMFAPLDSPTRNSASHTLQPGRIPGHEVSPGELLTQFFRSLVHEVREVGDIGEVASVENLYSNVYGPVHIPVDFLTVRSRYTVPRHI